ncbi:hypothetical protein N0V93_008262 [Gnomoniopsis smithogilvyi]|uniref:DUF7702 domain-containing protein n=1 Tax=Gnomoniopsis smithogilvyi TaxID=1191159 RepID=A0A9W8YLD8_9PEZI|nr:hypothetical protein N0V93_008262 [Gnomoniopsis smithogilvyi]
MASADVAYAAAVLAIYIVLFFPAVYTSSKHGVQGMAWLCWRFFILFCIVRIIGNALEMANPGSTAAAIISSVGLSPLTIAIGGALHEARFYLLSLHRYPDKRKVDIIFVLLFHLVVAGAIALLAAGASGLQSATNQADPTKLNTDWHLAGVGGLILVAVIALLFLGAVYAYICYKPSNMQQHLAQRLVVAVAVACPLLAIRMIGSAAFYFSENLDMNPMTGTWGFKVGLYLIPEVLAACTLLAGGLVTRNIREREVVREETVVMGRGMKSSGRGV